jgi:hypothetical protein
MEQAKRFWFALGMYAVLGMLAWAVMSSDPIDIAGSQISFRGLTLLILGVFTARTVLSWRASRIREESEPQE